MAQRNASGFGALVASKTFTIATGADGSAVTAVDLERNCAGIVIRCTDCEFIDAATTMTLLVGMTLDDTLVDLHYVANPGTVWVSGVLPDVAGETFHFMITDAAFVRRVRIVLLNVVTGSGDQVDFEVWGFDPAQPTAN